MRYLIFSLLIIFTGCKMKKEQVDLLVKDATVYTVDDAFTVTEAFVVKDGKILDTGTTAAMEEQYRPGEVLSLKGLFVYPGWNDAHCHFTGYGLSLNQVDLMGTGSVEDVLRRCIAFAENDTVNDLQTIPGEESGQHDLPVITTRGTPEHLPWITGRGWDQNDWEVKAFPGKHDLDRVFPDIPVLLRRVDGHAGWANSKALELAGINAESRIEGGEVVVRNGEPTGILIDNAIGLVDRHIPEPGREEIIAGLLKAEQNCFAVGLTSVSDAGLSTEVIQLIDSLHRSDQLKMRINAWLEPSESNFDTFISQGPLREDRLTVGTLKLYADGALGSRGARMIEPYADDPGNRGLYLTEKEKLEAWCRKALEHDFQVATHCIGDAANRRMLQIYSGLLTEGNDRRWRIEHAQVIHPGDFRYFSTYNIVPSVQPTHATSDMYWAEDRLGKERMRGAYAYKTLLDELGWIANGSDFPVEDINPLYGFYAAVARKDHAGYPAEGFLASEAMNREEALRAMTTWAARAAFEEPYKGSIEKGKVADFVVMEKDIMTMDEAEIPLASVIKTYSGGEKVYEKQR